MFRNQLLALAFFLASTASAVAQQPQQNSTAPTGATQADTTAAVQQLFKQRRTGGTIWTTVGAILTGRIIGASIAGGADGAGSVVSSVLLLGGVPIGIGAGKLTRFGPAREKQVLDSYAQANTLPPYVRKRLKQKYFQK